MLPVNMEPIIGFMTQVPPGSQWAVISYPREMSAAGGGHRSPWRRPDPSAKGLRTETKSRGDRGRQSRSEHVNIQRSGGSTPLFQQHGGHD